MKLRHVLIVAVVFLYGELRHAYSRRKTKKRGRKRKEKKASERNEMELKERRSKGWGRNKG